MLRLLLLLQVLASCLWLGHSEVVEAFLGPCALFFYEKTPPRGALRPTNAARICQFYDNKYRFATLYDRNNRIPVYSAYICKPGPGDRDQPWLVEPQLIDQSYHKYMEGEDSIIREYKIKSQQIAKNQAIDKDYSEALFLDRGHLCPSGHHTGDDKNATFTLTNIVPQYTILNQGAWHDYENTVAQESQGCDTTYVLTGAVPGKTYISNGRVNVPSHIWSAACCVRGKQPINAWGAIAENKKDMNVVTRLNLKRLEKSLSDLYEGKDVTLFKNSCSQQ
ncbi:endonuclease domain-containing 1 protein-like [Catharus ustulatus]|uniref:ENDD1 protein n=1 Tax=Catharus ustulatus TaxID=91951 RepID=A0A8C3Y0N1_CATUS|nr:endonuclease domain-containing 1 protein-like [Catharus ustulatus]